MKYAIVGLGVVGKAIADGAQYRPTTVLDIDTSKQLSPERLNECEVCFVCVPTPTNKEGEQDLGPVRQALQTLMDLKFKGVIALKSTVLPGTTRGLARIFEIGDRLVHNPEFLCAKTAAEDFKNQKSILLSGNMQARSKVEELHGHLIAACYVEVHHETEWEATEYAKYIHNCALPVMLSFLNEVHSLLAMESKTYLYGAIVHMAKQFGNLPELTSVPGPDGKFGWGGPCFLKDTLALIMHSVKKGKDMNTLIGAVSTNLDIRPEDYQQFER